MKKRKRRGKNYFLNTLNVFNLEMFFLQNSTFVTSKLHGKDLRSYFRNILKFQTEYD